MKTITACASLILAMCVASIAQAVVTFDWATVGNPGNAPDNEVTQDGTTGYGSVDYTYRISKFEVTNAQYTEFLNVVDPTGANADLGGADGFLYDPDMSSEPRRAGINLNAGAANGSKYKVIPGRENTPVAFVSFFDAMRFVNWLENGQGSGSTESGVYTIGSGIDEVRNRSASIFIPSEDEWYKAAYYDSNSSVYYDYATGADTEPYSDNPNSLNTPDDTNVANLYKDDGIANGYDDGLAVTGSPNFNTDEYVLTEVGAYSQSAGPYGTFDQSGNILEWTEGIFLREPPRTPLRALRGGSWGDNPSAGHAAYRSPAGPGSNSGFGFRVASRIPEPGTALLGALAAVGLLMQRSRPTAVSAKR